MLSRESKEIIPENAVLTSGEFKGDQVTLFNPP